MAWASWKVLSGCQVVPIFCPLTSDLCPPSSGLRFVRAFAFWPRILREVQWFYRISGQNRFQNNFPGLLAKPSRDPVSTAPWANCILAGNAGSWLTQGVANCGTRLAQDLTLEDCS